MPQRCERPSIAVDNRGAAHVAWNADVGGTTRTNNCGVPGGTAGGPAAGCPTSHAFRPPTGRETFDRPQVVVTPDQRVLVVRRTCCGPNEVRLRASDDRGGSFAADHVLATDAGTASLFGPVSQGGAMGLYSGDISAFSEDGTGRLLWRTYDGSGVMEDTFRQPHASCAGDF